MTKIWKRKSLDRPPSPATDPIVRRGVGDSRSADDGNREDRSPSPRAVTSVSTTLAGPSSAGVVHDLNVVREHAFHDAMVLMNAVDTITELTSKVIAVIEAVKQRDAEIRRLSRHDADAVCVDVVRSIVIGD